MKQYASLFVVITVAVIMVLFGFSAGPANADTPPHQNYQYAEISFNGNEYTGPYAPDNPDEFPSAINSLEIGEFLSRTTAAGYDDYGTKPTLNCEIYSLKSMSAEFAVAVKYEGYNGYCIFTNSSYIPETLGDMIRDLGLRSDSKYRNITFFRFGSFSRGDGPISITYTMPDDLAIWELLLANSSAKGSRYGGDSPLGDFMYARISHEIVGVIFLSIYPDGPLIVHFSFSPKASASIIFLADKDTVWAFMNYIETHGDVKEDDYGNANGDGNETSNEANNWKLWIIAGTVLLVFVVIVVMRKRRR